MHELLGIECTDKQLKNCFERMVAKYKEIKDKLNSSGFGVDMENEKTLDKGK